MIKLGDNVQVIEKNSMHTGKKGVVKGFSGMYRGQQVIYVVFGECDSSTFADYQLRLLRQPLNIKVKIYEEESSY